MGRLCVAARGAFPEALGMLRAWLIPLTHLDSVVRMLYEADLGSQFPSQVLDFLSVVIGEQTRDLKTCLDAIWTTDPELETNHHYVRLENYLRMSGQG